MGSTWSSGTNSSMSIIFEASPSRALSSSSVNCTYWSFANSYPLTRAERSTTSLQVGQMSCWRMRPPHLGWIWLKAMPLEEAAENILTGIDTRPNEIVPDPMECGGIRRSSSGEVAEDASTVFYFAQPIVHRPPHPER